MYSVKNKIVFLFTKEELSADLEIIISAKIGIDFLHYTIL